MRVSGNRLGFALFAGALTLSASACDSAQLLEPEFKHNANTVQVISNVERSGDEALNYSIATLERLSADPEIQARVAISDPGGVSAVLASLKAFQAAGADTKPAEGTPIAYSLGQYATGYSTIWREGPIPHRRTVDYLSQTSCNGYSSMVTIGGEMRIRQTASNGYVTFSGTYSINNQYGSTSASRSIELTVDGEAQFGTVNATHTCRETWYSGTQTYGSSASGTV